MTLQVNHAAMAQAAQEINEKANIIRGLQVQLQGHRDDLQPGWKGTASLSFNNVFNEFDADFKQILDALDKMHEALVQTHISYQSREADAAEAVSEVQRLLG